MTIKLASPARWLLVLPAVIALLLSWFTIRWYVGNTVAEYSPTVENGGIDMARMAVRWAPGDPFTHWRLASLEQKVFSAENLADAARECQLAVILSPYDYRYWMELGRALETTGNVPDGEKALKRALDLAPAYSQPRWYYGNLLLREGKLDEAFVQLAFAARVDDLMRPPVFALASQVFEGDVDKIVAAACSTPAVRLEFATYLVYRGKIDEAMRVWRSISPADKRTESRLDEGFKHALTDSKHFREVLEVTREIESGEDGPAPEQIWNGGFELDPQPTIAKNFYWIIQSKPQVRIGIDTVARTGKGSLRVVFKSPDKLEGIGLAQTVVVTPDTQYHFEGYFQTQDLNSGSLPSISILDAATENVLVSSPPALSGTNSWQKVTLDFKTGLKNDGIIIRLTRAACNLQEAVCPIFGTIWYDDFSLQSRQAGSPGSARGSAASDKR